MHGENFLVNYGGNWQTVETIGKCLPQLDVVTPFAFIVEAINTVDRGAFMVSSKDEKVFWVLDLVCQKKTDCFQRLFSSIYVIAKEEVVGFWWESSIFK